MYQANERSEERPSKVYGFIPKRYYGDVRFPDTGLKCVVYIGTHGENGFQPKGTGFLIQHRRDYEALPVYYLVTAHHVIRGLPDPNKFAVRLNRADGTAGALLSPKHAKWWRHPTDQSVDTVVCGWGVRGSDYPYKLFETERFLTNANLERTMIGVGDEAYIVGMFSEVAGINLITPMVRTGHIAMMATERIPTTNYGPAFMHLIEGFSLAGFSGSPVFVHETVSVELPIEHQMDAQWLNGVGNLYLLGLVHGLLPIKIKGNEKTAIKSDQIWHSGISMVVPSTQILEILEQPDLIAFEKNLIKGEGGTEPIETSIADEPKDKNRDISIPPITRKKFLTALAKATRKRDKK